MAVVRNRLVQIAADALVFTVAFGLAYLVRYDWQPGIAAVKRLLFQWPYVVGFEVLVFYALGAHRLVWRFIALKDTLRLAAYVLASTVVLMLFRVISAEIEWGYAQYALVPFGVIAINFLLAASGIVGVRVLRRLQFERKERLSHLAAEEPKRIVLLGAGRAGQLAAREISGRPHLGMHVVGFLDDDPNKIGTQIQGITVLGATSNLEKIVARKNVDEVIIAMAQVGGEVIRHLVAQCKAIDVPVKILPGLYEIIGGQVSVNRIRDVQIEDLLGREPVELAEDAIADFVQQKVVLVTGAGGSIGSEVCRQVAGLGPNRLVLVERSENALFEIHSELVRRHPGLTIVPRIADVTDRDRMHRVIRDHGCHALFHAAAHKHVPMMEWNPGEAIRNNVVGTRVIADLADELGVEHFVFISTDKAVNPTSVMGASKRVAELYLQGKAKRGRGTTFVAVRFGNVLGSNGSVIPIFKRQIDQGGPVTVTHPDMQRYFMTIPEATQLVLQAATMGEGGEVFILDMGTPVKILDLAHDMIRLSGLEPGRDVEIAFSGIRPGEKLFEELSTDDELADKTRHEKIFIGRVKEADWGELTAGIAQLSASIDELDEREIYTTLRGLIPEFSGQAATEGQVIPLTKER